MTHLVDTALWTAAVVLGSAALWLSRPRPPTYDTARLFGMLVATRIRGEVEAAGGDMPQWKARIDAELPKGPHPGVTGWTGDPAALGPDHDPAVRVGADCTWDAVADWTEAARAAVRRRLADVRLVWIGAEAFPVPEIDSVTLPAPDDAAIAALLNRPELRVVLAAGDAPALLQWLHDAPALRDRVRAVVLVGAQVDPAWATEHLTHGAFETELVREVPFLQLRTDGAAALPEPAEATNHRRSIALVDLGEVAATKVSTDIHGRALAVLLAAIG